jgi:hypothetical protein
VTDEPTVATPTNGHKAAQPYTHTTYDVHEARFEPGLGDTSCWLAIPHDARRTVQTIAFFRAPEDLERLIDELVLVAARWQARVTDPRRAAAAEAAR